MTRLPYLGITLLLIVSVLVSSVLYNSTPVLLSVVASYDSVELLDIHGDTVKPLLIEDTILSDSTVVWTLACVRGSNCLIWIRKQVWDSSYDVVQEMVDDVVISVNGFITSSVVVHGCGDIQEPHSEPRTMCIRDFVGYFPLKRKYRC